MKLRPTGAYAGVDAAAFPTARKVVARMLEQGHKDVLCYENMEGGHGGAADNQQSAQLKALRLAFFWSALGGR